MGDGKDFFQLLSWTPKNEEVEIHRDDMVDSNVQDKQVNEPLHTIS